MSYITFDYKCPNCGHIESRFVRKDEQDVQYHYECTNEDGKHVMMTKLPPGPITNFKFGDRSAIKSKKAVSLRDKH